MPGLCSLTADISYLRFCTSVICIVEISFCIQNFSMKDMDPVTCMSVHGKLHISGDFLPEMHALFLQPVDKLRIVNAAGFVVGNRIAVIAEDNLVVRKFHGVNFPFIQHGKEIAVAHLAHLRGKNLRENQRVHQHQYDRADYRVIEQWFLWRFYFLHVLHTPVFSNSETIFLLYKNELRYATARFDRPGSLCFFLPAMV